MRSFPVPYTDDQLEVDTERGLVLLYLNAWNRESSGTPDRTFTFVELRADRHLLASLTGMLAGGERAEVERLVLSDAG